MAFQFHSEDADRTVSFASEGAYEAALDWYNVSTKVEIIAYCDRIGVNIHKDAKTLVNGWHDLAMEAWAARR